MCVCARPFKPRLARSPSRPAGARVARSVVRCARGRHHTHARGACLRRGSPPQQGLPAAAADDSLTVTTTAPLRACRKRLKPPRAAAPSRPHARCVLEPPRAISDGHTRRRCRRQQARRRRRGAAARGRAARGGRRRAVPAPPPPHHGRLGELDLSLLTTRPTQMRKCLRVVSETSCAGDEMRKKHCCACRYALPCLALLVLALLAGACFACWRLLCLLATQHT